MFAESVGGTSAPSVPDDRVLITLRHSNGSIANIAYLSGGDPSLAKERVEIFGGGKVVVIDDFSCVTLYAGGKQKRVWRGRQDKGHRNELETFVRLVAQGGAAPIAWTQLRATTLAAALAVRSLREGGPKEVR